MATEINSLPSLAATGEQKLLARLLNIVRKDVAAKYAGDSANLVTPVIKAVDVVDDGVLVALTTVAARKITIYNDTGGVLFVCYTADNTKFVGLPNGAIASFPVVANANEIKLKRTGAAPSTKTVGFLVENFA